MTRPLRVAVVARSVFPLHGLGGLERSVHDLVNYLDKAGISVTLITRTAERLRPERGAKSPSESAWGWGPTRSDKCGPEASTITNVTMRFVPYRTFPLAGRRGTTVLDRSTAYPLFGERAGRAVFDLVARGEIDVVHGFGASVLGYARRRARATAPLVLNPQGLEEFGATDPARARMKRAAYLPLRRAVIACARTADAVIATDRVLEPAVRTHLKVPAERVRVIPNALDLPALDRLATGADGERIRREAGIGDAEFVLLSVGRIEENKGFHVLAAALGALGRDGSRLPTGGWRWVVVGDGPFRPRLERAIGDAGLRDRTIVTGRLPDRDLHAWYEAAALFVHPSLYEGSSLVTLEAMAHRRAVVATTAGGLPDKVAPGVTGWLVAPGDASALAAALGAAAGETARLAGMGLAGREVVERQFSWETAGAATVRLYRDLVG